MSPKHASRLTAILVALAECGSDPPSGVDHSLTTCDISTGSNAGMPCERACATHRDETDIDCQAHSDSPPPNGTDVTCTGTFGLEGVIGCLLCRAARYDRPALRRVPLTA